MALEDCLIIDDVNMTENDIHSKFEYQKINKVIDRLGINRMLWFKDSGKKQTLAVFKKRSRSDIELFNKVLEIAYSEEKNLKMYHIFLILCADYIDVQKAVLCLTQNNLSIIKQELLTKNPYIKGSGFNTLQDFFR